MYNLQLETFIVVADLGSFNKRRKRFISHRRRLQNRLISSKRIWNFSFLSGPTEGFLLRKPENLCTGMQNILFNTAKILWNGQRRRWKKRTTSSGSELPP